MEILYLEIEGIIPRVKIGLLFLGWIWKSLDKKSPIRLVIYQNLRERFKRY